MRTRAGTNSGLTGKEKEKEKDKLARQNSTEKLNELLLHNTHHPAVLRQQVSRSEGGVENKERGREEKKIKLIQSTEGEQVPTAVWTA